MYNINTTNGPTTEAKDQIATVLNPITGQLDMVQKFNPNRIVTHNFNQSGNALVIYDPVTGLYQPMDALVVTDIQGNVVTT